jgi:hypothetical protein
MVQEGTLPVSADSEEREAGYGSAQEPRIPCFERFVVWSSQNSFGENRRIKSALSQWTVKKQSVPAGG